MNFDVINSSKINNSNRRFGTVVADRVIVNYLAVRNTQSFCFQLPA